jgi:hypothetical protein
MCDVFFDAGSYLNSVDPEFLDEGVIKKMDENAIPLIGFLSTLYSAIK